jgi:class 3 adenylate cyclase
MRSAFTFAAFLLFFSNLYQAFSQDINPALVLEKLIKIDEDRKKISDKSSEDYIRLTWQAAEANKQLNYDGVAVQLYEEVIGIAEKSGNKKLLAEAHRRLGDFYPTLKFYKKAKKSYLQATELYKITDNWQEYKEITYKIGKAAYDVRDYNSANDILGDLLDFSAPNTYQIEKEMRGDVLKMLFKLHKKQGSTSKAQFYATLLSNHEKGGDKDLQNELQKYLKIDRGMLSQREVQKLQKQIEELERGLKMTVLQNRKKDDTISNQQTAIEAQQREIQLQKEVVKLKEREKILEQERLETRNRNNLILGGSVLSIILLAATVIIFIIQRSNRKLSQKNALIEAQKNEIEIEKEKSDALLLNILPAKTAHELKEKGQTEPQFYETVSVIFTDFKGFTHISEKLTPQQIIHELNVCFQKFDEIIEKHNLEKIKTIGDAYMCAGGIPEKNSTNPVDAVRAALEMQEFMRAWKEEKIKKGEDFFELRLGIHTGALVAGVIGKKKFAYDIWGDTVNLAARMESSGEVGKVNISGETYRFIKDRFTCTHRGKIPAKNKGEIDMYFVEYENIK